MLQPCLTGVKAISNEREEGNMNKEVYLARVAKTPDGRYAIDFPDLPGTHAQCKDLLSVQKEAEESLCSYLLAAETIGMKAAPPSKTISLQPGDMAVLITADLDLYRRKQDNRPIRKTVSLPQWMVTGAEEKGLPFHYSK